MSPRLALLFRDFVATTPVSTDVARPVVGALPLSMRFVFEG